MGACENTEHDSTAIHCCTLWIGLGEMPEELDRIVSINSMHRAMRSFRLAVVGAGDNGKAVFGNEIQGCIRAIDPEAFGAIQIFYSSCR